MSDCRIDVISVDDDEVQIKVECNFVYSNQNHTRAGIRRAFEELIEKYAI